MIKKEFRLKENEVKKVLKIWKPFFSYNIVCNICDNKKSNNRFWIIISSKSVKNNVSRVYLRRLFYNRVWKIDNNNWKDIVFLVKKTFKFNYKDNKTIENINNDLNFLILKNNL